MGVLALGAMFWGGCIAVYVVAALLPMKPKLDECPDRPAKQNTPGMSAAYQVTARLNASEQNVVWTRTGAFFTFTTFAVPIVFVYATPWLQKVLGITGIVLTLLFWRSGERAWKFRDLFVAIMRAQEEWLGVQELGPLTQGKGIKGWATQPWIFRALVLAAALVWFASVARGYRWVTFSDKPEGSTAAQPLMDVNYFCMGAPTILADGRQVSSFVASGSCRR